MRGRNLRNANPRAIMLVLTAITLCYTIVGCSRTNTGYSSQQKQAIDRIGSIALKSGGDWNKVSPADRQFLINGPGYGNETDAREYLSAEAEHLKMGLPAPEGPPKAMLPSGHAPAGGPAQGGPSIPGQ